MSKKLLGQKQVKRFKFQVRKCEHTLNFICSYYECSVQFSDLKQLSYARYANLLKNQLVESLQSHIILTMSHWSSGLPVASRHKGPRFKSPEGYLCETRILLLRCLATLVTPM
jgi:hypothetical protein